MTPPAPGAAVRLVGRALRPPVGDPVRFPVGVASPDPPWPSVPVADVVRRGPGDPTRREGVTVAPAPLEPEPASAWAGDGLADPATVVPGPPPARRSPPAAVPPVPVLGPWAVGPAPAGDGVVASPTRTVASVAAPSRTLEPVTGPGWAALAKGDDGGAPEAASSLARAMAWLAQPADPRPADAPRVVGAGVAQPPSSSPTPTPPPLTPPPRADAPQPASAQAAPSRPTVVIDRIEIVAGPRLGPPGDPLASLADRRRGASRHAGAR